jgi:aminomethyltransferase
MDKGDFLGRAALEKARSEGLKRTLVGLEALDRGIPRDDYKVFDQAGLEIGYITSGSYAPYLKKNIALAYVPPAHAGVGNEVFVEIRGQKVKCKIVATPFYRRAKKA